MTRKFLKSKNKNIPLPIFFPDATRGFVKSLDLLDVELTKTPGVLVNTFHLWQELKKEVLENFGDISRFMSWNGGTISDSGGFQIMSVIKEGKLKGKITDEGAIYYPSSKRKVILTPEKSIEFQMRLGTDMVVVLDDFTNPDSSYKDAKISVERTINWAKRSKEEFLRICDKLVLPQDKRPYILGVAQGAYFQDLREYCTKELVKIGFDGIGYGGWPMDSQNNFDYESASTIANNTPDNYFLYGLGVGKPEDIVGCSKLGFNIFDCVLPTRDGRHGRLYIYNSDSIETININEDKFYSFLIPDKEIYSSDNSPISKACDCLLCTKYSRAYLNHLFKMGDFTAGRLCSIHNLRFYSILMEKIRKTIDSE
jgi:queuine tRNA-ribosyltransferase